MKRSLLFLTCLVFSFFFLHCSIFQGSIKNNQIAFDYAAISKNYFSPQNSKPFPLTVQRGTNLHNSTTKDGRYLFYATDQNGNFDIWFRDLKTSVVVPVTDQPFSQHKPAISPDGNYLVFVSEEFDSEGDLVLLNIDIREWVTESLKGNRFPEQRIEYLTNRENQTKSESVLDTDPVWSADGKVLFFISDRFSPGLPNLCSMDPKNPKSIKQLTTDGATRPSVSPDGEFVYFISYKESNLGEVYQFELNSKRISRITNNAFLDFSPSISNNGKTLYYASIRKDTNGNGVLEERDHSILVMRNLDTGKERYLSSGDTSFFDVRYSAFNGGSVLFSASFDNAINIYFIPENGSIPKQNSIQDQYQYAKTFLKGQNLEEYFLAVDSIELFFAEDPLFPLYWARSQILKYKASLRSGKLELAESFLLVLKDPKEKNVTSFSKGLFLMEEAKRKQKEFDDKLFLSKENQFPLDGIPFLLHLLAEEKEEKKQYVDALFLLQRINNEFPEYHQASEIRRRLGGYEFNFNSNRLPLVYEKMINSWEEERANFTTSSDVAFSLDRKRDLRFLWEDIVSKLSVGKSPTEILEKVESSLLAEETKRFPLYKTLLLYVKAEVLAKQRQYAKSNEILDQIIPIPNQVELEPAGKPSVFESRENLAAYKNSTLLRANLLKYLNQKSLGNTSDALRNLKIYLEFYDPELGVVLEAEEIQSAFFYFENKAIEFERVGDLLQSSFHYFFNNQNMFLVKTRDLYLDSVYKQYAVYYQRKMVDTIFRYGKKLREEEERALLSQINILSKDRLNVVGNLSNVTSLVTDNEILRGVVDLKDLEKIEVLSSKALGWTELYYKVAVPRARPYLDLATLYGYSYYLINKYVTYESYYNGTNTMTEARKLEILENFKKAEAELRWIIFAEPKYYDAYQLLGWLYQYVDLVKLQKNPNTGRTEEETYEDLYKRFFPSKNLEGNIELYNQILVFLGEDFGDQKIRSDLNLNLGNNYFLLNNYPKANEKYSLVEAVSQSLASRTQFESYKQKAVFHYNFGKSLIYQGDYKKASNQFAQAIQIYFRNEYYQSVNAYSAEPTKQRKSQLDQVKAKLSLLYSLAGLSQLESFDYENSIVSFQTAIAYNQEINFIHPANLYNYLAISLQRNGRFNESYKMLDFAEDSYRKWKPNFLTKLKKRSWSDLVFSDDFKVIGEGRFPGEFPDEFKHLLTLGVRIENHIEQEEYSLALKEVNDRNNFIDTEGLDSTIVGRTILAKSKQVEAQIYQRASKRKDALQAYKELIQLLLKQGTLQSLQNSMDAYAKAAFDWFEQEDVLLESKELELKELAKFLELWKQKSISDCTSLICEDEFRAEYPKYDLISGNLFYYQALVEREKGKDPNPKLILAYEHLENPGLVDPRKIGLLNDSISRRTRIRNLINLYLIYQMLGDSLLAEKRWKEATELSYEFRLEEEMFWAKTLKFQVLTNDPKNQKETKETIKSLKSDLLKTYQSSLSLRLLTPIPKLKTFVTTLLENQLTEKDISNMVNLWENFRSLVLYRSFIQSQMEFEDSKFNLTYRDLIQAHRNWNRGQMALLDRSVRRENVSTLVQSVNRDANTLLKIQNKLNSLNPDMGAFLRPNRDTNLSFVENWVGVFPGKLETSWIIKSQKGNQTWEILASPPELNGMNLIQIVGDVQNVNSWVSNQSPFYEKNLLPFYIFDREHAPIFTERNERKLKWVTLYSKSKLSGNQKQVRTVDADKLELSLYDTDYLVTDENCGKSLSLFGDRLSQCLPLRELFTSNGSEVSLVGFPKEVFSSKEMWNRLGYIYDILRSKRIQNVTAFDTIEKGLDPYQKFGWFFGAWTDYQPSAAMQVKEALRLKRLGEDLEKGKETNEAYEKYYTASTLLAEEDKHLPELELKLARLKSEKFPQYPKIGFFKPFWEKYRGNPFQNTIFYEYLSLCYASKEKEKCERDSNRFIGEDAEKFEKAISFYIQLKDGNVSRLEEANAIRKLVEKNEDPFLQSYRLGSLYLQNYLFQYADRETETLAKLAKTVREKTIVKNRELEILFHKGFLWGDEGIYTTDLKSTSAYSLGFQKEWKSYEDKVFSREFTKFGYSDSIYDQYRIKLYQSWKQKEIEGQFDPLALTPEYLTTGESVLSKLSQLNRTLLFYLLSESIVHQKETEVFSLLDLLQTTEQSESRLYRSLFFLWRTADRALLRGEFETSQKILTRLETENSRLESSNVSLHEKIQDLQAKHFYFTKRNMNQTPRWGVFKYFDQAQKAKQPRDFINITNDWLRDNKQKVMAPDSFTELEFLFFYLLQLSLEKNSSESFFDLAIARDQVRAYQDRYQKTRALWKEIPIFHNYSDTLKSKMVGKQELNAIFDLGKKSYLLSFANGKSLGRELFSDNKEIYRELQKYNLLLDSGDTEVLLRESISLRYRNALRLNKLQRHYLYLSGLHARAPIQLPETEVYYVANLEIFVNSPSVFAKSMNQSTLDISLSGANGSDEATMVSNLLTWELGLRKESNGPVAVDFREISFCEDKYICIGGEAISSTAKKAKKVLKIFAYQNLISKFPSSADFTPVAYHLAKEEHPFFVLHSGVQWGIHNISFMKSFLQSSDGNRSFSVRLEDGRESARWSSKEDKYWLGYRLFTNAIIQD